MPNELLLLIPGLPFLAALWIVLGFIFGWNRGEKGERETAFVVVTANTLSLSLCSMKKTFTAAAICPSLCVKASTPRRLSEFSINCCIAEHPKDCFAKT